MLALCSTASGCTRSPLCWGRVPGTGVATVERASGDRKVFRFQAESFAPHAALCSPPELSDFSTSHRQNRTTVNQGRERPLKTSFGSTPNGLCPARGKEADHHPEGALSEVNKAYGYTLPVGGGGRCVHPLDLVCHPRTDKWWPCHNT